MGTLSVVIITANDAGRIRPCLKAVGWADEVIVVDSGSQDGTVEACVAFGAQLHHRAFDTFDRQKNFGLALAKGDWILSLDADERVSPELRTEIQGVVSRDGVGCDGFLLHRQNYLCGRPIRHAWGRDALVRLVRRGHGCFRGAVHEQLTVDGRIGELAEPLLHFNSESLKEYGAKNLRHVALEAETGREKGAPCSILRAVLSPLHVFVFRYCWLRGFRDGWMGFVLSVLLAFFSFLIHASQSHRMALEPHP